MNTILAAAFLLLSLPAAATVSTVDGKVSPRATALIPDSVVSTTVTISNLAVGGVIFSSTPADGRLSVDASNLFWDDTNNRLGIGTAIPATKLHMSSGALTLDGTNNRGIIGSTLVVTNGRVGIGTTAPETKLHIKGDGIMLEPSTGAESSKNFSALVPTTEGTNGFLYVGFEQDVIQLRTASTNALRVDSSQRVGIGTTVPTTKLHMSSGTLTIDGTGGAFILSGSGTPVTISTWTATYTSGSAHVCVNDSGVLFVSEAACP